MASHSNFSEMLSPSPLQPVSWTTLTKPDTRVILTTAWTTGSWSDNHTRESQNAQDHLRKLSDAVAFDLLPTFVFIAFLVLLGIPGNLVVFLVYLKRFKPSSTRVYVLVMCGADLVINALGLPTCVLFLRHLYDFPNPELCRLIFVCARFPGSVSAWLLSFVAVDRHQRICSPFRKPQSEATARHLALLSIFLGSALTFPFISLYGTTSVSVEGLSIPGSRCGIQDVYLKSTYRTLESIVFAICAIISLGIIVAAYVLIGCKLYGHAHQRKFSDAHQKREKGGTPRHETDCQASVELETDNAIDVQTPDSLNYSSDACESDTESESGPHVGASRGSKRNGHVTLDAMQRSIVLKSVKSEGNGLSRTRMAASPLNARRAIPDDTRGSKGQHGTLSQPGKLTNAHVSFSLKTRLFQTESSSSRLTFSSTTSWRCSRTTLMLFVVTVVYLFSVLPYTVLS